MKRRMLRLWKLQEKRDGKWVDCDVPKRTRAVAIRVYQSLMLDAALSGGPIRRLVPTKEWADVWHGPYGI